ncbi:MAG: hypothetical protein M3Y80_00270 [Verrucomicrobiota bacterium]|nr:hypothetical protein [Verrucomicrobiota bacterium]
MGVQLTIDRERRVVIGIGSGIVTDEDVAASQLLLKADPNFDSSYARLWDLSAVTELELSDDLVRRLLQQPLSDRSAARAIVCVAPQVLERVMAFADVSRRSNRDIAFFPTREEAFKWLALQRAQA